MFPPHDTITIGQVPVAWRRSVRARRLGLTVRPGGGVSMTVPVRCGWETVRRFLSSHEAWIVETVRRMSQLPPPVPRAEARRAYLAHRERARRCAYALVAKYAPLYGLRVRSISIRDQRSRWGSCSRDGRISLNYRIALLPEDAAAYVVVHELCHMLEFNHSQAFWRQVARAIPDHRLIRKRLVHALR